MFRTRHTIRKKFAHPKVYLIFLIGIVLLFIIFRLLSSHANSEAYKVVDQFYSLEQGSNFAASWELFHPYMQSKFSKNGYIQERNHVFMQHFGVTTFDYNIGKPKKLTNWSISNPPELPLIDQVYKFPVTKQYKSKFGTFNIVQNVYAANHEGKWVILWSYK